MTVATRIDSSVDEIRWEVSDLLTNACGNAFGATDVLRKRVFKKSEEGDEVDLPDIADWLDLTSDCLNSALDSVRRAARLVAQARS